MRYLDSITDVVLKASGNIVLVILLVAVGVILVIEARTNEAIRKSKPPSVYYLKINR